MNKMKHPKHAPNLSNIGITMKVSTHVRLDPEFAENPHTFALRNGVRLVGEVLPATSFKKDRANGDKRLIDKANAHLVKHGAIRLFIQRDKTGDWLNSIDLDPAVLLSDDMRLPFDEESLANSLTILRREITPLLADPQDSVHLVPGLVRDESVCAFWSRVTCCLVGPGAQLKFIRKLSHPLTGPEQGREEKTKLTPKTKPSTNSDTELDRPSLSSNTEENILITIASTAPTEPLPDLGDDDIRYREEREKIVTRAVNQGLAAAKALHEIKSYRDGLLWRKEFHTFEDYCRKHWGYQKSQAYRHVRAGAFVAKLAENHSPIGENSKITESHLRPVLDKVPAELQVECWQALTAGTPEDSKLTAGTITTQVKKFLKEKGQPPKGKKPEQHDDRERAIRDMEKFRASLLKLNPPERLKSLLQEFSNFINQEPDGESIAVEATDVIHCNLKHQNDPAPCQRDRVSLACDKQAEGETIASTKGGITAEIVAAAMDAVTPPHERSKGNATAKLEKDTAVYQRNLVVTEKCARTSPNETESQQDKQDTADFMNAQLFHDVLHPGGDYATWLNKIYESHPADIRIPSDGGAASISLIRAKNLAFNTQTNTTPFKLLIKASESSSGNPGATADALFEQHALAADHSSC